MFINLHMSKNVQDRTWVVRGLKILRRNVDSRCFCYVPNRWETPNPRERGILTVFSSKNLEQLGRIDCYSRHFAENSRNFLSIKILYAICQKWWNRHTSESTSGLSILTSNWRVVLMFKTGFVKRSFFFKIQHLLSGKLLAVMNRCEEIDCQDLRSIKSLC